MVLTLLVKHNIIRGHPSGSGSLVYWAYHFAPCNLNASITVYYSYEGYGQNGFHSNQTEPRIIS